MFVRAAGDSALFVLSLLGLLLLVFSRPTFLLVGPVLVVGLFAFLGGHRFLVYLSPLLPLGLAWLAVRLVSALPLGRWVGPASLATAPMLLPAALATMLHSAPTVLASAEVELLERLGEVATRRDTTLAWWDYGYPIGYFARTRTITDGGRRWGDAALIAEILMSTSDERARRLALLTAGAEVRSEAGAASITIRAARAQGLGPEAWLDQVEAGTWRPGELTPSGEVYLYLPLRMMPVIPTIAQYRAGKKQAAVQLVMYHGVEVSGTRLILKDGLEVDGGTAVMRRRDPKGGWEDKPLRRIYSVGGSGTQRRARAKEGTEGARTSGVLLSDLGVFVALDASLLDTLWARLFLLEQPPAGFTLVSNTQAGKLYRVRPD